MFDRIPVLYTFIKFNRSFLNNFSREQYILKRIWPIFYCSVRIWSQYQHIWNTFQPFWILQNLIYSTRSHENCSSISNEPDSATVYNENWMYTDVFTYLRSTVTLIETFDLEVEHRIELVKSSVQSQKKHL